MLEPPAFEIEGACTRRRGAETLHFTFARDQKTFAGSSA